MVAIINGNKQAIGATITARGSILSRINHWIRQCIRPAISGNIQSITLIDWSGKTPGRHTAGTIHWITNEDILGEEIRIRIAGEHRDWPIPFGEEHPIPVSTSAAAELTYEVCKIKSGRLFAIFTSKPFPAIPGVQLRILWNGYDFVNQFVDNTIKI